MVRHNEECVAEIQRGVEWACISPTACCRGDGPQSMRFVYVQLSLWRFKTLHRWGGGAPAKRGA
jgi:hypothetical protein